MDRSEAMLNQHGIANAFEVSTAAVREWTNQGLPCVRDGRETLYDVGVVMHWFLGRECRLRNAALRNRRFTPAEQIAMGWMLCHEGKPGNEGREVFAGLMKHCGFTDAETWDAYGLARGIYSAHY